jgi:WXG100 family type VII secretion target
MAPIVLSPAQLESKKAELSSLSTTLRAQMDDLLSLIKSLQAVWDGPAADAFQQRGLAEIRRIENMLAVFNAYIAAIDKAMAQYKNTERINVSIARK